jgi:putative hydrolase of the HAD superfamily
MDNHHDNAWARLERGEMDPGEFAHAFEVEARAAGGELDGGAILGLLVGEVRSPMADEVRRLVSAGYGVGFLTNNAVPFSEVADSLPEGLGDLLGLVHSVVESAVTGLRKPEPAFYDLALRDLGAEPQRTAFLDDLGVNLKPARAMGMTTIKVDDPQDAIEQLRVALSERPRIS